MIGSSAKTMKKFKLLLDHVKLCDGKLGLAGLSRNYQAVHLSVDESAISDLEPVFQQVKSLSLGYMTIKDPERLSSILQSFPLLESLTVTVVSFVTSPTVPLLFSHPSALSKLKYFEFCNSAREVLEYLRGIQPSSCALRVFSTRSSPTTSHLASFLSSLTKLSVLELNERSFHLLFQSKLESLSRLRKLIYPKSFPSQIADKNFIEFLKDQSSLEELVLNTMSKEIFIIIFTQLANLKSLKLTINWEKIEKSFFNQLKPNKTLKKLCLSYGTIDSTETAQQVLIEGILGNCPEIESLDVTSYYCATLDSTALAMFISVNNRRIKHLSLLTSEPAADVKFQCLESLQVENIESVDTLIAFLKSNSSVKYFKSKNITSRQVEENAFDELMDLESLKYLTFSGDLVARQKLLEKSHGKKKFVFFETVIQLDL